MKIILKPTFQIPFVKMKLWDSIQSRMFLFHLFDVAIPSLISAVLLFICNWKEKNLQILMSNVASVFLVSDIAISPLSVGDPWSQLLVFLKGDSSFEQKQDWCGRQALFHFSFGFLRVGWSLTLDIWSWFMNCDPNLDVAVKHCSIFVQIFSVFAAPWSSKWLVSIVPFLLMFCPSAQLLPSQLASPFHAQLGSWNLMSCQRWKYKRTRGRGNDLIRLKPFQLWNYHIDLFKDYEEIFGGFQLAD